MQIISKTQPTALKTADIMVTLCTTLESQFY